MNRTLTHAQSHTRLNDYQHLARLLSRERSKETREGRGFSRSPKQHQHAETEQYRQLQERYLDLEGKYRELLERVKQRTADHEKLKAEIKGYQKTHERDTLEIQRLRLIIGLVKKRSVSIQVEEEQLDSSFPRGSRLNKFDQSTEDEIKLKHSGEKARDKGSPYRQAGRKEECEGVGAGKEKEGQFSRSRVQYALDRTEKQLPASKYSREIRQSIASNVKLSNSPYSKLRFVPSPVFQ